MIQENKQRSLILYHQSLISRLPEDELFNLDRLCRRLRGEKWGTANFYVFNHPPIALFSYHSLVMRELYGVRFDWGKWQWPTYRGDKIRRWSIYRLYGTNEAIAINKVFRQYHFSNNPIYPEQNDDYLKLSLQAIEKNGIKLKEEDNDEM